MAQLKALGGLRLEGTAFTRPTALLLLTYLSLKGPQKRRHVAELFWQDGNRMKSLSMALTRLRQGAGEVVEVDEKHAKATLPCDAKELLESLDKSQWQQANDLYTGAFLEGVVLEDWGNELEEWVYTTREYLAERVQYALLNLAEEAAKEQDFTLAGALAEKAYQLPGLSGNELGALKRLYPLLCAAQSLLAPVVRKDAETYDLKLELTSEAARSGFKTEQETRASKVLVSSLPIRKTSFVGRKTELAELSKMLSRPEIVLVSLVGTGGVGKTRLALQLAHEQQKLGTFKDNVYFVSLDALQDSQLIPSMLISHFGLVQQASQEPLEQIINFLAQRNSLLILDNFEHLLEGTVLLSQLIASCPKLKLLITSREKLRLEEEYVFALEGLPYPQTLTDETRFNDAVRLFNERAQQVQPRFDLEKNLNEVIRICQLVDGLPLALELAASWIRLMPCSDIASEIQANLEFLTSVNKNTPDRHRSLKAVFDYSWQLLSPKEQEVLRKLSVFAGGFRREAAREVAGATIPILASLVDKSLLRVLPNGRYDRHPLLHQFTQEKLAEQTPEEQDALVNHAKYFFSLVEQAEPNLQSYQQLLWFGRLDEELDNIRLVLAWLEDQGEAETFLALASCLGRFWFIRGHYNEGRSYLSKAVALAPDSKAVAKALAFAGNITFIQGDIATAKACYEQSLTLAKGWDDKLIATLALQGLGRITFMNEGNPSLGRTYYEESLALARAANDPYSIAFVLASLGYLTREQGDYSLARIYFEESLQLDEAIGNQLGAAENMNSLANLYLEQGERSKALPLYEKSLEIYRAFNERRGIVQELANMGLAAIQLGDYQKAYQLHQEALQLARELGDKRSTVDMLNYLATDLIGLEEYAKADVLLKQCLIMARELGNKWQLGDVLRKVAEVCEAGGEPEQARDYYQQCLELAHEVNDKWGVAHTSYPLGLWYLDHDDVVTAHHLLKEALDIALQMQLRELVIKALEGFARLAAIREAFIEASQLLGYAATLRETLEVHYLPRQQRRFEDDLGFVKSKVGANFHNHWSIGKKMTLEQVLELALANSDSSPQPTTTAAIATTPPWPSPIVASQLGRD